MKLKYSIVYNKIKQIVNSEESGQNNVQAYHDIMFNISLSYDLQKP